MNAQQAQAAIGAFFGILAAGPPPLELGDVVRVRGHKRDAVVVALRHVCGGWDIVAKQVMEHIPGKPWVLGKRVFGVKASGVGKTWNRAKP